ncbi:MAG: Outer membrane protein A [Candidatus Ordinivivax streblomastigis]|uniref:Outer membrane protein A n=1 Tax=Candidatus Ordinivivax streblomastigis TaxID=2540710 RepID=A0A5M8P1W9_9BACT|nr:MAG: Outer membrane protein A [Candidatus Ordinivivax streblomastigis]
MNWKYLFFLTILFPLLLLSCKSAKLSDAVAREERGEYFDAARIYRKVYGKTSPKKTFLRGSVAFHVGECYREVNHPARALSGYTNAIRYKYADSTAVLHQAQMLHKLGRYAEAIKAYQAFLQQSPDDVLAKNGLTGCESAQVWKQNPTRYAVRKMEEMSSREGEYAPMLGGADFDELYLSSSRKEALGDDKSPITGMKNNDFFVIKQNEKKQWQKPEHIASGINTVGDEGTASFSLDGSQLYYTACLNDSMSSHTAEIHVSSRSGAEWSAGSKVSVFKDSLSMAAHPAVGVDGYLYFVSDIQGGYGGKDIWRVPIDGIGTLFPENLGPDINTPGNEVFPYMRADSVLFFSSDGHPGMGGLDIFKAGFYQGQWRVENMKSPVNSMGDDFGITFAGRKESGFFSSNRNDGRGADHIYSFHLPGVSVAVEGWVLNRNEEDVDSAMVRIVGKDGTNQRIFVRSDATYYMEVKPGMDYVMMASAPGYLNQKQVLSVPDEGKSETYYIDFALPSISKPELVENIFYDFNKASLRPESKAALEILLVMLQDNPNVTIELSAHTDRVGSEEYNENLSQRRAQSVVDYLIKGGIEPERLTAKGYGKIRPTSVSKSVADKYDFLPLEQLLDAEFIATLEPVQQAVADQINRRTEFQVLSVTYGLR